MHENGGVVIIGFITTIFAGNLIEALMIGAMGAMGAWIAKKTLDFISKQIIKIIKKTKNGNY
jgi:hypothetical protein